MPRRIVHLPAWLLGYRGVPPLSRPTFRRELLSGVFLGLGIGVVLPQFAQLFVTETLGDPTGPVVEGGRATV
jgi:hypothetical protein